MRRKNAFVSHASVLRVMVIAIAERDHLNALGEHLVESKF